jgi:hypothetical protein
MGQVVTKKEFAEMVGRSQGAISKWIKNGTISSSALVGFGVRAKINVDKAKKQLGINLDVGQQMGQGSPVLLEDDNVASIEHHAVVPVDNDARRYAKLKADTLEMDVEKKRRLMMEQQGYWVLRSQVESAFRKEFVGLIDSFEVFLGDVSDNLSSKFGGSAKDYTVILREKFRDFRARYSKEKEQEQKLFLLKKNNINEKNVYINLKFIFYVLYHFIQME